MNIVKYELAQTPLNATVDAITHVYCYVEYSVPTIGAREGILLGGGTICPKNKLIMHLGNI